jgi:hypothetical protein
MGLRAGLGGPRPSTPLKLLRRSAGARARRRFQSESSLINGLRRHSGPRRLAPARFARSDIKRAADGAALASAPHGGDEPLTPMS